MHFSNGEVQDEAILIITEEGSVAGVWAVELNISMIVIHCRDSWSTIDIVLWIDFCDS